MPRDRNPQSISPKRQRERFLQAVRDISPERIRETLARDSDLIGDWYLLVVEGRAIIEGVSRLHGRVVMRFSDQVLEAACVTHLEAVGLIFRTSAEADEYCRLKAVACREPPDEILANPDG